MYVFKFSYRSFISQFSTTTEVVCRSVSSLSALRHSISLSNLKHQMTAFDKHARIGDDTPRRGVPDSDRISEAPLWKMFLHWNKFALKFETWHLSENRYTQPS